MITLYEIIDTLPNKKWDWRLQKIPNIKRNITFENIKQNKDKQHNWKALSRYICISYNELKNNLDKPWDYNNFSKNPHLTWKFVKDQGVTEGEDAVWVDQITFPPVYTSNILLGDVNGDTLINVQDIVLIVNLVLSAGYDSAADLNSDGITNVLDIVQIVNIILN